MECQQKLDGSHMTESLDLKVSSLWQKCLALLHRSSFPTSSVQVMLNDSRLKNIGCDKAESWEEILVALTEEDAVIHQEDLKLQPIFFCLSKIVQTRFLHLVQLNASKICSHHLKLFVSKLENVDTAKSHWTEFYISILKQSLNSDTKRNDLTSSKTQGDYAFCATSKALLADLTRDQCISSDVPPISDAATAKSSCNRLSSVKGVRGKVVDVIIEDGSDDSEDTPSLMTKTGSYNKKTFLPSRQTGKSDNVNRNKSSKIIQIKAISTSDNNSYSDVSTAGVGKHKVIISHGTDFDKNREESVLSISDEESCEPDLKVPKLLAKEDMECVHSCPTENQKASQDGSHAQLSNSVKANLVKLKESCFAENKSTPLMPSKLSFLLDLSLCELESAIEFLKLSDCSEESLIPFCEAVPWTKLDHRCASVLLHGCVFRKVTTSNSQISQTLLTFISAVLRDQPQAVLDFLIKAVNKQPNNFQCQMVASLCKEALSQEWLCYLIKQLNEELTVDVDANILGVLQAVINRQPDLDPVTMTLLLALLTRSGQVAANSPVLGKCLMVCLTKYSKQITADNSATLSSLVDTHGSNFKAALRAAFKRLNK